MHLSLNLCINSAPLDHPSINLKSKDTPSVGSVSGGGCYDDLVGMFDKGRMVTFCLYMYMHLL